MSISKEILIIISVMVLVSIVVMAIVFPSGTPAKPSIFNMECADVGPNLLRCENKEMTCYVYLSGGVDCFKK